MAREYKNYGIRPANRASEHPSFSSVVFIANDEEGRSGYCFIKFEQPLVKAAGKRLSRGVSAMDPAHLHVRYDVKRKVWVVCAKYLKDPFEKAFLWETDVKPSWLKTINKRAEHGKANEKASGRRCTETGTSDSPQSGPGTGDQRGGAE